MKRVFSTLFLGIFLGIVLAGVYLLGEFKTAGDNFCQAELSQVLSESSSEAFVPGDYAIVTEGEILVYDILPDSSNSQDNHSVDDIIHKRGIIFESLGSGTFSTLTDFPIKQAKNHTHDNCCEMTLRKTGDALSKHTLVAYSIKGNMLTFLSSV